LILFNYKINFTNYFLGSIRFTTNFAIHFEFVNHSFHYCLVILSHNSRNHLLHLPHFISQIPKTDSQPFLDQSLPLISRFDLLLHSLYAMTDDNNFQDQHPQCSSFARPNSSFANSRRLIPLRHRNWVSFLHSKVIINRYFLRSSVSWSLLRHFLETNQIGLNYFDLGRKRHCYFLLTNYWSSLDRERKSVLANFHSMKMKRGLGVSYHLDYHLPSLQLFWFLFIASGSLRRYLCLLVH
jgi:hypothetical protein